MEIQENQGALFANEKKNDKQPDFGGKVNIGGKEFHAAGWDNKEKGLKLNLSEKVGEQYRDVGGGLLSVNEKGENDKRPNYRGEIRLNGESINVSVWKKETKEMKPMLSVQTSPNLDRKKDIEHKANHAAQKEVQKGMGL